LSSCNQLSKAVVLPIAPTGSARDAVLSQGGWVRGGEQSEPTKKLLRFLLETERVLLQVGQLNTLKRGAAAATDDRPGFYPSGADVIDVD
jgi:hypothetical protein